MDTRIKFCGLTRPQDIEEALTLGVDFLGFILECESPRALSVEQATKLVRPVRHLAKSVAVTVNASDNVLTQICDHMKPDFFQLHGDETPDRINAIKALTQIPLIKALPIHTRKDLEQATLYEPLVDYLLLDAKPPKQSSQRGGHGIAFDWSILDEFTPSIPYILAGGLTPHNITTAIRNTRAKIFDVSSGIEASAGVKDHALMAQLMRAVRDE